jgi:quercetin dioxygenase-like cupin family protein
MAAVERPDYPVVSTGQGVTRQVLAEGPELMTVAFRFEKGAVGDLHKHFHVQSTFVQGGKFMFHVGGKDIELAEGQSVIIPSNVVHGCKALEAGCLIDAFTPRRDDFL